MLAANHGRKSHHAGMPGIKNGTKKRRLPERKRRLIDRDT
jgi:hypothetical protein